MDLITLLFAALIPVAILLFYIFRKDRKNPEPKSLLFKAFGFGLLSVLVSLCISFPLGYLGLYPQVEITAFDAVRSAFFSAAFPEELAKLFMLWLLLRKNKFFDEHVDGIVYAVFIGLGFAGFENLLYLSTSEDFVSVAILRALFAVPGHFIDAVAMGYFYSLATFSLQHRRKYALLSLGVPVLIHGIYDSLLMMNQGLGNLLSLIIMFIFLGFCFKTWKYASRKIAEHQHRDGIL